MTDNGLTPVSAASGAPGIFEPNPNRAAALDTLKRRCETFSELGLTRIYQPAIATAKYTADDYKAGAANMREVGRDRQPVQADLHGRTGAQLDLHRHPGDAAPR